jgi:hypothetical protein
MNLLNLINLSSAHVYLSSSTDNVDVLVHPIAAWIWIFEEIVCGRKVCGVNASLPDPACHDTTQSKSQQKKKKDDATPLARAAPAASCAPGRDPLASGPLRLTIAVTLLPWVATKGAVTTLETDCFTDRWARWFWNLPRGRRSYKLGPQEAHPPPPPPPTCAGTSFLLAPPCPVLSFNSWVLDILVRASRRHGRCQSHYQPKNRWKDSLPIHSRYIVGWVLSW